MVDSSGILATVILSAVANQPFSGTAFAASMAGIGQLRCPRVHRHPNLEKA